jgi:hypothetical protein
MADVTISSLSPIAVTSGLLLPVSNGTSTGSVTIANINSLAPVQSVAARTGAVVLTKTDVGLSSVTNDAQLKIASNLSDLNNAATARTNLGIPLRVVAYVLFDGTAATPITPLRSSGVSTVDRTGTGQYSITLNSSYTVDTMLMVSGSREATADQGPGYGPYIRWSADTGSSNIIKVATQGTAGLANWYRLNVYVLQ